MHFFIRNCLGCFKRSRPLFFFLLCLHAEKRELAAEKLDFRRRKKAYFSVFSVKTGNPFNFSYSEPAYSFCDTGACNFFYVRD